MYMQADFFVFSRSQQMNLYKFELVKGMMQMELMKKDIGKWVISQNLDGYILSIDQEEEQQLLNFLMVFSKRSDCSIRKFNTK